MLSDKSTPSNNHFHNIKPIAMTEPQMKTFRREGYKGTPIWQNNPGNLPNKGIDWLGKVPTTQREGNAKYEEFISVE